jgi:hypothetical protein
MFNIRRLLNLFKKPWEKTPAKPRIDPILFSFDLPHDGIRHLLRDGIIYARNQVNGTVILLACSDIPVMHVSRARLELTLALPDKCRIEGDITTHDVHDLRLWIPDEVLAPRFAEWRAADEAARKIGAPTPGRDLHMPGGAVLLCCHLAGNSLDIEGRTPITCRGHMSAEQYEKENPDRFCLTREDGECVSPDPRCMHNRFDVDVAIATVAEGEVSAVEVTGADLGDGPCLHCDSTPYDNTRCRKCGSAADIESGAVKEVPVLR